MRRVTPDGLHDMADVVANVEFVIKLRAGAGLFHLCKSKKHDEEYCCTMTFVACTHQHKTSSVTPSNDPRQVDVS